MSNLEEAPQIEGERKPFRPDDGRIVREYGEEPQDNLASRYSQEFAYLEALHLTDETKALIAKGEIRMATIVLNDLTVELGKLTREWQYGQRVEGKRYGNNQPPHSRKISSARVKNQRGQILPATTENIIGVNRELFSNDSTTRRVLDHIAKNTFERQSTARRAPDAVYEELRLGYNTDMADTIKDNLSHYSGVSIEKFTLPMALEAAISQVKDTNANRPSIIVTNVPSPFDNTKNIVVAAWPGNLIQLFDTSELPKTVNATDCAIVYRINTNDSQLKG